MNSQSFMNKIKTIIFISALIFSINTNAQWIGSLEIADENIKPWIATSQTEYSGIYHFGESESESELLLSFSEHSIIGKIKIGLIKTEIFLLINIQANSIFTKMKMDNNHKV